MTEYFFFGQLYGDLFPERFGAFTTAALTMFQLCTGDGWMTDVVRPLMDKGLLVNKKIKSKTKKRR
jgi:hypothetical protein